MPSAFTSEIRQQLLADLFDHPESILDGVDKRRFRVRHHEQIEAIDAMVNGGAIRERQDRYSPSLTALTSVATPAVQSFLKDCEATYAALRARYLENHVELISPDTLAETAGIDPVRFRRTLALLNDNISVIACSQGSYTDPNCMIAPSDRVLEVRTFDQALTALRDMEAAFGGRRLGQIVQQKAPPPKEELTTRAAPQLLEQIPEALCALMQEIYLAQESGLRALPSMGVRAVIDMACNDLVGDTGGFDAKLKALAKLGHVSELQRETLSAVINLGHASAHRGHIPVDNDIRAIVDIVERLLKSLYLDPETMQRLKGNTPGRGR